MYVRISDYKNAIQDFNSALKIKPNWTNGFYGLGTTYEAMYKFDIAVEFYNKSIAADSTNCRTINNLGYLYFKQKNYSEAIKQYTRAIGVKPKYTIAMTNRADAYLAIGRKDLACADISNAIGLGRHDLKVKSKEICNNSDFQK